jgi:hypothetical protein
MDFTPRSDNSSSSSSSTPSRTATTSSAKKTNKKWSGVFRWGAVVLLFSVLVLVLAIIASIAFSNPKSESSYVKEDNLQAVFLNGGQVYFGNITNMNDRYIAMSNVYYLRVNQQVQPGQTDAASDVSLVKLGCELHGPQDQMVINTDQVIFWENLKTDGQVAKAVQEYVKQNPNGQNCSTEQQSQTPAATTPAATTTKKQ